MFGSPSFPIHAASTVSDAGAFFPGQGGGTTWNIGADGTVQFTSLTSVSGVYVFNADGTCQLGSPLLTGDGSGNLQGLTITALVGFVGTGILQPDTGWTANADGGDKTKSIGTSASLATIATALNLVSAGAGTALQAVAEKCKALETALVAALIPNA